MVRRLIRVTFAIALSVSWLAAAGLPAGALVTNPRVARPDPDAVITKDVRLVVVLDWTREPRSEDVAVRTRMMDGEGAVFGCPKQEVNPEQEPDPEAEPPPAPDPNCGVLYLEAEPVEGENGGEPTVRRRFSGSIDPHALAWLNGEVAGNGRVTLQYQWEERSGDADGDGKPDQVTGRGNWQSHPLTFNAPPPPQSTPIARVTNIKKKQVTIAWAPNRAPDITSYTLERKAADSDWKVLRRDIRPDKNRVVDNVRKLGSFRYRVTAARAAANPDDPPLTARSLPSTTVKVASFEDTYGDPEGPDSNTTTSNNGFGDSPVAGSGPGPTTSFDTSGPAPFAAPADANQTYKGPLDYGVAPREVTERVPVDVAQGGSQADDTLTVIDAAIDQERVLPPLAGGLILIVSAAHVLRYLNE